MEDCLNRLAMAFCLSRDLHRPEHLGEQLNCWKIVVADGYCLLLNTILSHNPFHISPTSYPHYIYDARDPPEMQLEPTKAKKIPSTLSPNCCEHLANSGEDESSEENPDPSSSGW